jgi:hypothetical protein
MAGFIARSATGRITPSLVPVACRSVPADAGVVQPPAVAEGELAVGVDPVGADPVVAVAGPVLDEPVGQRREVQRVPRRASVVVRAGIKDGAWGAAGPMLAPGSASGEARPARTGPHAWRARAEWLVSQRDRVCARAVFLGFDCPARGGRVKIACGVAARSASLNLHSASAHEGLAPARTTGQTSRASLSALGRASNHSDGGQKTHAAA